MPQPGGMPAITRLWRAGGWLGIALTLVFSLGPPTVGEDDSGLDKLAHLAGYALLMFWWAQLVVARRWRLALAVIAFGAAIELLQGLTPARQPDPVDALANATGVLLGWGIARLLPHLPTRIAALPALRR
ncbi:MAG: VanZ family protein [Pseudomonadota bacterium]